jgi:hypothetical protein
MPFIQVGGHRGGSRAVAPVFAEVDDDDLERVSAFKWSINSNSSRHTKYAISITGGTKQHLHRLIMGLGDYATDKRVVNHIDGNGLNNKKSNLEICDTLYNSQPFTRHNSPAGCVSIDTSMKRVKKWRATITIYKVRYQKRFETEEEGWLWISEQLESYSD